MATRTKIDLRKEEEFDYDQYITVQFSTEYDNITNFDAACNKLSAKGFKPTSGPIILNDSSSEVYLYQQWCKKAKTENKTLDINITNDVLKIKKVYNN